jgi:hypothetical protein
MTDNNFNENPTEAADSKNDPFGAFLHHQKRALEESAKAIDALLPEGFKEHSKEAGREFTKGFKVLVDAAIEGLEKAGEEMDKNFKRSTSTASDEGDDRPASTGRGKVKVQVD